MTRKKITQEELEKHNTENDAWILAHGFVLEVNQELKEDHPGGAEVILALAGKDATEDFEDIGHTDSARSWADRCIIGYIEGRDDLADETKVFPQNKDVAALEKEKLGLNKYTPIVVAIGIAIGAYFYMK